MISKEPNYFDFEKIEISFDYRDTVRLLGRVFNVYKKVYIPLDVLLLVIHRDLSLLFFCLNQSENYKRDVVLYFNSLLNFINNVELVSKYCEDIQIMVYTDLIRINYGENIDKTKQVELYRDLYINKGLLLAVDEYVDDFGSLEEIRSYVQKYYDVFLKLFEEELNEEKLFSSLIVLLYEMDEPIKGYYKINKI